MVPYIEMATCGQGGCLHDLFTTQAAKTPNKTAVVTADGQKITFDELNAITDVLADKLRICGVGRNKVVGIFMERCLEYTVSYIAVLKAGGAYLPIEMSYPKNLIQSVLDDCKPVVICTKAAYNQLLNTTIPSLFLQNNWVEQYAEEINGLAIKPTREHVLLDDMAYTVYSSGTTGRPKGIVCPHRGAVYSYVWRHLAFPYDDDDREACNVFFVWEMLRPLLKGIPMYIIPDNVIYDPPKLVAFLKEHKITRMLFTPSLLQAVLDTQASSLKDCFKTMKQIWLCGEVVTTTLRNRIASSLPWVKILNLYSISECHDVACSDLTEGFGLEGRTYCPVGKIFNGVHVVVMDDDYNVKSIGDPGEVYVGGPTLAIGYLNRPDLNEQRFIKTPASLVDAYGSRLYRTGDWGYLLSDGSLEIIGRCDSMVKIRGYTVELKAIEAAFLTIPEINMSCVLSIGAEGSDKFLVAYVVLNEGYPRNVNNIRSKLKFLLPFYMIPSQFVFLEKIPILDTSGKINKKELPPARGFSEEDINVDNFSNPLARALATIWCRILKISFVDATDNFFDLGGHSLLAATAVNQINEELKIDLSVLDLYSSSTIKLLLENITTGESNKKNKPTAQSHHAKSYIKIDLEALVAEPNLQLRVFWKSVNLGKKQFSRGNILLTGATGYLGSFVLKQLLEETQATIYCLVRASKSQNAHERLENVLTTRRIPKDYLATRIVLIIGDVSLNKFGMDDVDYMALSYDVNAVIHCGAQVNLILPYGALHSANVVGTQMVVTFCMDGKLKPLHYISTSDVFPENLKNCQETHNMLEHADQLQQGYGQSKWLAEQIVNSALMNGLPVVISRFGNIAGSQTLPVWNDNDLILLILRGVILSRSAPDIDWKVELSPVDFIAESIVKLTVGVTTYFGKKFNFINSDTMDCRNIWQYLQQIGYEINIVPYEQWTECVRKTAAHFDNLKPLVQLLSTRLKADDYLTNASTFAQDNVNKLLSDCGATYPRFNNIMLDKYMKTLMDGQYIPAPPRHDSSQFQLTKSVITSLSGKVALVTGASSGIGRAIAKQLAMSGIVTLAIARRIDKLMELQNESEYASTLVPMKVDVTNRDEVFSCISQVKANVGSIDILVNSAGSMDYCKMIDCQLDSWVKMVELNCIGLLNVTAAVLPHMKGSKSGHIVNITSDAGRKPFAGLAVYSGTKYFGECVSEAMRQELVPYNIKVTCIQPGDTTTELHGKTKNPELLAEYGTQAEYLRAEDVANAVLYALNQPPNCAVNSILLEPIGAPI